MKMRLMFVGACVATFLLATCASGSGGSRSDQNRLTYEEINSVDVSSLYEVVQRLRPRWLEVRATRSAFDTRDTEIVVYMDRTLLGGVEELRSLGPETARWLQYLSAAEASAALPGIGSRQVEGAVVVHTVDRP
jgi:hypothetical protein